MSERERFVVELEDAGGEVPVGVRLRRFLKAALRGYGLRCTSAAKQGPAQSQADRPPGAGYTSATGGATMEQCDVR